MFNVIRGIIEFKADCEQRLAALAEYGECYDFDEFLELEQAALKSIELTPWYECLPQRSRCAVTVLGAPVHQAFVGVGFQSDDIPF